MDTDSKRKKVNGLQPEIDMFDDLSGKVVHNVTNI